MEFTYKETFDLMAAYHSLGENENKIIKYLMMMDYFEGDCTEFARKVYIEPNNFRNCLNYLDALGIINIVKTKYLNEVEEYVRKDGKKTSSINKMKACYLVDGWMEILIKQYKEDNIHNNATRKREFINRMKALWNE